MPSRCRGGIAEERSNPQPMMNGMEKSDSVIVAVKSANKGTPVPAEPMEPRTEPKGNPKSQSMRRTQDRESVSQAADRIRQFVQREPGVRLTALLRHITVDALRWAFFEMKKNAAAGVDGMTWRMYEEGLEGRLADMHDRVHSGAYRARPSRRVNIPKPDGGTRPLGIAAIEDKIVQKAVAETILTPIYEAEFLGFSYGFRPGRGTHNALDALAVGMRWRKIAWVVDCDIRAFFDTVSRSWLVRLLEHRIGGRRVIRLIVKWLKAGVMDRWPVAGHPAGHAPGRDRFADAGEHLPALCATNTLTVTEVWSCMRDEGGPLGAGDQAQASNHRKLRRSRAGVVSVAEKAGHDPVR